MNNGGYRFPQIPPLKVKFSSKCNNSTQLIVEHCCIISRPSGEKNLKNNMWTWKFSRRESYHENKLRTIVYTLLDNSYFCLLFFLKIWSTLICGNYSIEITTIIEREKCLVRRPWLIECAFIFIEQLQKWNINNVHIFKIVQLFETLRVALPAIL